MAGPIPVPDVTVEQIFETQNPTLTPPDLPTVLIGLCRQIEFKEDAGEYDGTAMALAYPSLKTDAVVDQDSVDVFFSNDDGVFQITDFTTDADSINIEGGIELDIRKIENSQTGTSAGIFFTDTEVNFFSAFGDLTNTASIVISSPSDNQQTFDVQAIIDKNTIRVKAHDDGQIRSSAAFAASFSSADLTFVDDGDGSTTEPLAVAKDGFIVGGIATTITLANTYGASVTVIDSESAINNETDIVAGDMIFFVALGPASLKKIASVNASTGAVTLATTLGTTISAGTGYKVFHPVRVKNQTLNTSGDFLVATKASDSSIFTAEIDSIVGMSTVTVHESLQNSSESQNTAGWSASDSYQVHRGILKDTDSNVYDGSITDADYQADILVSYKAVRNDLNSDIEAITGVDDIDSILGPGTPDNPLSLAARYALQVSDNLLYVIGVSADTTTAHQVALEVLESKEVYYLVPLTQDINIIAAYKSHVDNLSEPSEKMERVAVVNRDIFISNLVTIGTTNKVQGGTDSSDRFVLGLISQDDFAATQPTATASLAINGIGFGANVGDRFIRFWGTDQSTISTGLIASIKTDLSSITIDSAITWTAGDDWQIISLHDTTSFADGSSTLDSVSIGDAINLLDANGDIDETATVTSKLSPVGDGSLREILVLDGDLGTSLQNKTFSITTQPLSKLEQAQYIRDYASSILDRRVTHVYAPQANLSFTSVEDSTTETTELLPGYYLAAAVAALKSENVPSQPMTNVPLPISTQLFYTNDYFKPSYLDIIAGGGNYILVQTTPESLPYCRQQLTTDVTSTETQEWSITTAVDFFAKFMRTQLRPFVGRFNITDNYLAQVKGVAGAVINRTVKILKYLRDVKIVAIGQDTENPTEVFLDLDVVVLYPANKIRVRLFI